MKSLRFLSIAFLFSAFYYSSMAQLTSTNLPIIIITTPVTVGTSAVQGNFSLINNASGVNTPASAPAYTGIIGIKLRGNAITQSYSKKSYTIETWSTPSVSLDTSLLGMPAENDWVLLASYPDRSLLRTALSFNLHEKMGRYAPRMKFCEVILNSQYQGIYAFGEKVKRDSGRVNISKLTAIDNAGLNLTGGYIWKMDDELGGGWSSSILPPYASTQHITFNYEYPDAGTITPVQAAYSKSYVDSFENAMNSPNFQDTTLGWRKFAAEGSLIDFMIMQEVSRNYEAYRQNTFLYKDKGKKLKFGPLWNGELAYFNTSNCNSAVDTGWCYNIGAVCGTEVKLPPFWWSKLTTDVSFMDSLKCAYVNYRRPGNVLDTISIFHFIDSVNTYLNAQNAISRNFTTWPIWGTPIVNEPTPMSISYTQEVSAIKSAIRKRLLWLDTKWISNNCPSPTGTTSMNADNVITVYPNPTTDKITINIDGNLKGPIVAFVHNVQGVEVAQLETSSSTFSIDLSAFSSGMYIIRIQTEKGSFVRKIVKE
jgi:hypothetical protein